MESILAIGFYLDFISKVSCILKISYKTPPKYLADNNAKLDEYETKDETSKQP